MMMILRRILRRIGTRRVERDIRAAFDAEFYLASYPDVGRAGINPLRHFVRHGWKEHRNPAPGFSTRHYLDSNPDVAAAGVNPFWHYLTSGKAEGRSPGPAVAAPGRTDHIHAVVKADLDRDFYLSAYPEIAAAGVDPVDHYLTYGAKEGRDPAPWFSTRFYLNSNPDVAAAGVNPFWHYLITGKAEGRAPRASAARGAGAGLGPAEVLAEGMDRDFYLSVYPEVAEAGVDPVDHYLTYGVKEGRDPAPWFSTRFYLDSNPDVVQGGINPFVHYLTSGKAEGRWPAHPAGYKATLLRNMRDLDSTAQAWQRRDPPGPLLDAATLRDRIAAAAPGHGNSPPPLVLAFGHDNYLKVSGGIQLCIQREARKSAAAGLTYLNVHPFQPLPYLARRETPDPLVCLVLAGAEIGVCRMSDLNRAVSDLARADTAVHLVIHALLGHSPEAILDLARAAKLRKCLVWLHDFFSICPSFTLQRNTISYCGAPDPDSTACGICVYGRERAEHRQRMAAFFAGLEITAVAPSKHTRALWQARAGLPAERVATAPHVKLSWHAAPEPAAAPKSDPNPAPGAATGPVRVAFTGFPAPHKGWLVYQDLARRFGASQRFDFYYFGIGEGIPATISKVPVRVDADNLGAMTEALAAHRIDLMVHWSSWPETFSFSTYEALAAGAYIVTNPVSGNVAATVRRLDRGAVLDRPGDLTAFFADGRAEAMGRQARARAGTETCHRTMSSMSVPFLLEEACS